MLRLEVGYREILLIIGALVAIWALLNLWPIIVILVTSFIFMAALLPYVEWLVDHRVPRTLAVAMIMSAILAVLIGLAILVIPAMVSEIGDLRDNLPEDAREAENLLADLGVEVELEDRARNINWDRLVSGESALDYGQRALSVGIALFTIFFLTAYLLADTPRMNRFLYQFVTPGHEPEVERVLLSLRRVVGGYIRGQLITSAVITVFTFVVLTAAGVPNAIAFAVLAGFVDIIPIIGAVIAVFLPAIAAFQESPTQGLIVVVALLLYQQFEDRILTPYVYGETLNLPPVIVLIAVLVGGALYGIAGVLLALPAAAAGRVALDYYLDRRSMGLATNVPGSEKAAPDTKETPA
ncbi:MAG TPA: AI-2E family transporter [Dehalococcoidia bacterium]|nr:AI-2E family transporter [Dehalococcoidia bacterium]